MSENDQEASLDFYSIEKKYAKSGSIEVYPNFLVKHSKDLMVRGGDYYAAWDQEKNLWNTDRMFVTNIIDRDVAKYIQKIKSSPRYSEEKVSGRYLRNFSSNHWVEFERYMKSIKDDYIQLDDKLAFEGMEYSKDEHISRKLPYLPKKGSYDAWEEMISTLYDPPEREKIEWAIGSILTGDSKKIQKFYVFYGPQGSGKSTIMNIVMKLFNGYYTNFHAENLVRTDDQFKLSFLASNPLVAIDEDTNLSKIETNATLNTIVSHEELLVNEKFKIPYRYKPTCTIMLGTNKPVKITDAKSGLIRRLIDIEPSGRKILPISKYEMLNDQIEFELGAIAWHCLQVYKKLGRYAYEDYIPERMMYRTDPFLNFMIDYQDRILKIQEDKGGITGVQIWELWKTYCNETGIEFTKKRFEIVDEAKNYFDDFKASTKCNGVPVRSFFTGLKLEKLNFSQEDDSKKTRMEKRAAEEKADPDSEPGNWLKLNCRKSLLDELLADCPAQYEITDESGKARPELSWKNVKTKLRDLDTTKTHYVRSGLFSEQLIQVDFDKRGADGKKDAKANIEAASKWPPTYAEFSNSGAGLHLAYWYDGDVTKLSSYFGEEIEIKVFPKDQLRALRRRVTRCNNLPIAHISSGLPLKEKKVINWDGVKDDRHLRNMVIQAIKKECRPYGEEPKTVTCVKYISDILKEAQASGMKYDIRDLGDAIYSFAAHSHHNKDECIKMYYDMELMWPKEVAEPTGVILDGKSSEEQPIIILDCEVVKNLTLVVYKELEPDGVAAVFKPKEKRMKKCIRLYNPTSSDIEKLIQNTRIVGHNVTGYDNFILYSKWLGYSPEQTAQLSKDIINGNRSPWREARNVSYTDTYDVSSDKKGLKKIEIEMHIPHKEMEIDWNAELPESEWERLATYCENDVLATEAYFLSDKWQADFKARKILAALTGMTVNDSTNNLTAQLIFGDVREPWHDFYYPDLKEKFPEYRFENGKSYYGDVLIGEGGRVYAEPGAYYDVITFDVAGMHPTSIIAEFGFGPYTKLYQDLYEARIAIKHKDYDTARKMFDGRLAPYLTSDDDADALSQALKIALNSVYGMTAAKFQNRFKDPRNIDNWVAKRGALFMEKLLREVQARGGHVIHIKTDSIKLVKPSQELQDFVVDFGKQYGYTFEVESKYERICLVNHAVYIAYRAKDDPGWLKECKKARKRAEETETPYIEPTRWTATGAQFAHPFVFKRLFSKENMDFWDFCEIKTVKTALYLDLNEKLPDVSREEKDRAKIVKRIKDLKKALLDVNTSELDKEKINAEIEDLQKDISVLDEDIAKGHSYQFVGKAGEFMPIREGYGGGLLVRKESDGGFGFATGAKGYRWLESESLQGRENWKEYIDIRYFKGLVDVAIETIGQFCDFEMFVQGDDHVILPEERMVEYSEDPWFHPCGNDKFAYCSDCPEFSNDGENGYCCKKGFNIKNQILGE